MAPLIKILSALSVFSVLTVSHIRANDSLRLALSFYQASKNDKALPIFIKLADKFAKSDSYNYALCKLKVAEIIRDYGGINIALQLLTENEQFLHLKTEKPTLLIAENHIAKGKTLHAASRLNEAKSEILKSIKIKKELHINESELIDDYLQLARYYLTFNDQGDSCFHWGVKALKIAKQDRKKNSYHLANIYNLLGYHYHPRSIAYFVDDLNLFQRRLVISRKYYDSAIYVIKRQPLRDALTQSRVYHNLGNSYNNEYALIAERHVMTNALHYYGRARLECEKFGSPTELTMKDWVIARAYERLGLHDSAIFQLQLGVNRLILQDKLSDPAALPALKPTINDSQLLTLISLKGANYSLRYRKLKQMDDLKSAYNHFLFLLRFNHYVISRSIDEQSQIYINNLYGSNAYQQLMASAYELSILTDDIRYVADVYPLIASGKYAWLTKNDRAPMLTAAIQTFVLEEEARIVTNNVLKQCKGITAESLGKLLPAPPKTVAPNSTRRTFADVQPDTTSLPHLQEALSRENATMIDYYQWGHHLYYAVVNENEFITGRLHVRKDFDLEVNNLKNHLLSDTPDKYATKANRMYKVLLDSILSRTNESDRLIICPDGILQNIPWDALVIDTTRTETFKTLDYALNHYTIRTISTPAKLLTKSESTGEFVGVGSGFHGSNRFTEIPFTAMLVQQKCKELDGILRANLTQSMNDVGILHLAGHVINEPLHPYRSTMYFSDHDSVTIGSLSKTRMSPSLVVLNACETGQGTYYQSEGTISFARALFTMGAQSVLMTLWNVDDKTTADIIANYYSLLQKGKPLDHALKEAKQNYLQNTSQDEMANPYYWGGLQLSGNSTPVFKNSYSLWRSISILITIAGIFGFFWLRKGRAFSIK